MNELTVINEQEVLGKDFRFYGSVDNPLFLAKDVAEWIEHTDLSRMVGLVDESEKLKRTLYVSGQGREMWFLTEDGLYEVLMQSRKPIAKEFKKKVKEILKTLRQTGGYVGNTEMFIENYLPFADENVKTLFKVTLTAMNQQNEIIKNQNIQLIEQQPKVEYYDELVDKKHNTSFRDTAKELNIKESELIDMLMGSFIYRDKKQRLKPYAIHVKNGLFVVKDFVNGRYVGCQTLITPKGKNRFREIIEKGKENQKYVG